MDSATLFELSVEERCDLETVIARLERKERARLANIPTDRLYRMLEE